MGGNGTENFPYNSLNDALNANIDQENTYMIMSSSAIEINNISQTKNFLQKTSIIGQALIAYSHVSINAEIFVENTLNLINLSISSTFNQSILFNISKNSTLIIQNCSISSLLGFSDSFIFFIDDFATLMIQFCQFINLSNYNIIGIFNSKFDANITITNTEFINIDISSTQLFVSNTSYLLLDSCDFINFTSNDTLISNGKGFYKLYNSKFALLNCNIINSYFASFPFFQIYQEETQNLENNRYEITFNNCSFTNIFFAYSNFYNSFIEISGISLSYISFKDVSFTNVTSLNCLIEIFYSNFSVFYNISFIKVNTNRDLSIIDSNYVEIYNALFYWNTVDPGSETHSTIIYLENVISKKMDNISMINCISFLIPAGITIISSKTSVNFSTFINNSIFKNNSMFYLEDNQASTALYVNSDSEYVLIQNSKFCYNILTSFTMLAKVGGACYRALGTNLKTLIIDSIFQGNKALYDSNCIQFEGYELTINNSFFQGNINYIAPTYKTIIESLGYGGSLFAIAHEITINSSFFLENMNYFGGDIYIDGKSEIDNILLTINKSVFIDDYSHTFGGCLYIDMNVNRMLAYITDCMVYYVWGNYNAAVYFNYDSTSAIVYIINSFFIENWSDFTPAIECDIINGYTYIINCSFFNNTASWIPRNTSRFGYDKVTTDLGSGGAIGQNSKIGISNFYLISENNTYIDNLSHLVGGVLLMIGGNFIDKNSIFKRNYATRTGSLYSHIRSTLSLYNTTIIESRTYFKITGISVREFSSLKIDRSTFINCVNPYGEGLIHLDTQSDAEITNSYFENVVSLNGGILNAVLNGNGRILFENNTFVNNLNTLTHEMFYMIGSYNIIFKNNSISNILNRVFTLDDSIISFHDDHIRYIDCQYSLEYGCLMSAYRKSNITMSNLVITDISSYSTMLIYAANTFFYSNNCIFMNNSIFNNNIAIFQFISSVIYLISNNFSYFSPGGFALISTFLFVDNTTFMKNDNNNLNYHLPVISSENSPFITILSSIFQNNTCSYNGSSIRIICNDSSLEYTISYSSFLSNSVGANGGAIYSENCGLNLNSNIFRNNTANLSGGSVCFKGKIALNLKNNSFYDNTAYEGGAIKYDKTIPIMHESNIFNNNNAIYGANIASYPIRLNIEEITLGKRLILEKKPSNLESIFINFTLSLTDILNQTVITTNNEEILIELKKLNEFDIIGVNGRSKILINNGVGILNQTFLYCNISSTKSANIYISTNSISDLVYINYTTFSSNELMIDKTYYVLIPLNVLNCNVGEIFDQKLLTCIICASGSFSLYLNSSECSLCPNEAEFCESSIITLKSGFWRSNVNSTNIYICEPISESCIGGYNSTCNTGYRGPLCQSCDVSDDIYSKSLGNLCILCSTDNLLIVIKLMAGSFFLVLYYIFIIYGNIKLINTIIIDDSTGEIDEKCKENFYSPIFNKILMNYIQICSLLKGLHLNWGSSMLSTFQFESVVGNAPKYLYNLDCLISQNSPIPAIYLKVIMVSLTPIAAMALLAVFWMIKSKLNKRNESNKYVTSELVILTILQPSIIDTMSSIISCTTIDGNSYLIDDTYFRCNDRDNEFYSNIFAIPSLILWAVFYPALNFLRLYFMRNKLRKIEIRRKYGFLYNGYRNKYYFWEFVEIYKKILLIFLINYFDLSIETKSLCFLLILFLSCAVLKEKQPYLTKELNKVAFLGELAMIITLFFGLLAYAGDEVFIIVWGYLSMALANITFIIYFLLRVSIVYKRKIENIIKKLPFFKKEIRSFISKLQKKMSVLQTKASFASHRKHTKLNNNVKPIENSTKNDNFVVPKKLKTNKIFI